MLYLENSKTDRYHVQSMLDYANMIMCELQEVDRCGVCGGDDSSCKDCNQVVKGGNHIILYKL